MKTIQKCISYFGSRSKMASILEIRYDLITKYISHKRFPSYKIANKIEEKTNGEIKAKDILFEKLNIKYEKSLQTYEDKDEDEDEYK